MSVFCCCRDLLSAEQLLSCLYADDYGTDTPNSANNYVLQRAGSVTSSFCAFILNVSVNSL